MAFTRADLTTYEAQPATQIENFDPFNPTAKSEPSSAEVTAEADPVPSTEESVTEPTETKVDDGSTTEPQAEPVAADPANPEGDKEPDLEATIDDGKPRSRAQERIEELVAERNALRKYGEYLLNQVEDMRKAPKGAQQDPPPAVASQAEATDTIPTLEDAEYDPAKFAKMQNEWIQKQVDKRVQSAVQQFETRQSEVQVRQAFEQRTTEFKKTAADFDVVIANPALPSLAREAARVVIQSENGPAIAYHLAKNPDLAARISRMEPINQATAIGRIEEQLVRAKADAANTQKEPSKQEPAKAAPAKVTKAPPPPKPVSGSSTAVQKPEHLMSMDEWVAQDRARKIADRKARASARTAYGK